MVKLPRTPQAWNDQPAAAPQATPPLDSDLNNGSSGLLGGWQSPAWSLENSGLSFVLHPQTIAQIDFGDKRVAQAAPAAVVNNNAAALPAGVDWGFINEREGVLTTGNVPKDKQHHPFAKSGVTIASGFDLGGRTAADLRRLGLSDDLVTSLTPYLGLRGQAAQDYLTAHPLNITPQQQQAIDTPTFTSTYNTVADNYNAAQRTGTRFQDLPRSAQTAIISVAHQYGTNLAAATPNFWTQVTTGRWRDAYDNLMNFGDAHGSRRQLEGGLMLNAINAGSLPPAPNIAGPRPGR
ncbi:MAG TPA: pesticin C-terminus-like muramidase [Rhizomicrobium sp.]|nr:pesticin C-terminus-like muramidase [Rhizomicrobium sp.]